MFVNNASGQRGLVCQYDVVCFDEISGVSFDQKDGVNILKGYMESGEFSRGNESIRADGGCHGRDVNATPKRVRACHRWISYPVLGADGLVPVPGVGRGVLTPDGNLATYLDRAILGPLHYGENTWFLSYLGFASSVLLGVLPGHLLASARPANTKVLLLVTAGVVCIAQGLLWSVEFPIIKLLWTSSFVLVSGGINFLALALFYWIIDVLGYDRWAFFYRDRDELARRLRGHHAVRLPPDRGHICRQVASPAWALG